MSKDPVKHCKLYKEDGCSHVDGMLCDFDTCTMRIDYENRYEKLLNIVTIHNSNCDIECQYNSKYCVDYLATGELCPSCPKHYKIKQDDKHS